MKKKTRAAANPVPFSRKSPRHADLETFYTRVGHLGRRFNQICVAIFLEENQDVGLTTVQFATLEMIDFLPGIDTSALASMVALDRTSLVKVVELLVTKGWVSKNRSSDDRRSMLLHATPEGVLILQRVRTRIPRVQERLLAPLDGLERAEFVRLLSIVVQVNNKYSRAPFKVPSRLLRRTA